MNFSVSSPPPLRNGKSFWHCTALRPLLCPVPLYKLITMHYEFNSKHISVYNRFSRKSHQADYKLQFSSQLHYSSGRPAPSFPEVVKVSSLFFFRISFQVFSVPNICLTNPLIYYCPILLQLQILPLVSKTPREKLKLFL